MTGQTAVDVAKAFGEAVDFDGVALTKLDGDARGGAALSVRAVSGKPILFIGTGEKLEALEPFYPDRMASRILGMGDVLSLIEKAQTTVDVGDAKKLEEKIRGGSLTLEDFLEQMQQVRRMGPMSQVLGMIPGFRNAAKGRDLNLDDRQIDRVEAIIKSMTLQERRHPEIINGSRRRRIASGSGTSVQEVNQLLAQFKQMRKMMKQMGRGRHARALRHLIDTQKSKGAPWSRFASPVWAARRTPSTASSWQMSARPVTGATSRRSGATTRRRTPRSSRSTSPRRTPGSRTARSPRRRSRS